MRLPGAGVARGYTVTGMAPLRKYVIEHRGAGCGDQMNNTSTTRSADERGVLRFDGLGEDGCEVSATQDV